jgi:S-adenosylmethionine:tRNA ribosyltransferase-isomerase
MNLSDYDFELPEELIAQHPPADRGDSRLLYHDSALDACVEKGFAGIIDLLRPGDLVVANDTRVLPARLQARKPSGGGVEILLERMLATDRMLVQLRANRPARVGQQLLVGGHSLTVTGRQDRFFELQVEGGGPVESLLREHGAMPLPPYIRRAPAGADSERYQTVYARVPGAVAAPTAGLHFTPDLIEALGKRGVGWETLTLHVGAGTFLPVQGDDLHSHRMHAEWISVPESLCERVRDTRATGGRVVAVGTTTARALETAAQSGELTPYEGDTRLFIRPGFRFHVVDCLITNFHLPRSTLLVLVTTFAGYHRVMAMYQYAVEHRFRFFSYGDAMLLARADQS